ncbi:MAG: HNH endonuclease [Terriglobia bacterium]
MAFWWVNHKQTRDQEVRGGYIWSPMRNANGSFNQTYDNMRLARQGDIVFSYAHGRIGAIGKVTEAVTPCPKPSSFGTIGGNWSDEGWMVEVEFQGAPKSISPKQNIEAIGPLLPERYSPIQRNGNGNQGCYLAGISDALGHVLMTLMNADAIRELNAQTAYDSQQSPDAKVLDDIHVIETDHSVPETQRMQLAKARVGQGFFRKQVILLDGACRVTGVTDTRVLIASHIKPWHDSTNPERISGYNGMLLSPHVDALFDEQLITFEDNGQMHVHPSLSKDVLDRWSIDPKRHVESFRPEQHQFLDHHRQLFAQKPR